MSRYDTSSVTPVLVELFRVAWGADRTFASRIRAMTYISFVPLFASASRTLVFFFVSISIAIFVFPSIFIFITLYYFNCSFPSSYFSFLIHGKCSFMYSPSSVCARPFALTRAPPAYVSLCQNFRLGYVKAPPTYGLMISQWGNVRSLFALKSPWPALFILLFNAAFHSLLLLRPLHMSYFVEAVGLGAEERPLHTYLC